MLFKRGYTELNERLEKRSKYTMSCYNCMYFYQTKEDVEEVCQNPNVLKYDMVVDENNIYCNQWSNCADTDKDRLVKSTDKVTRSIKDIYKRNKVIVIK